MQQSIACDLHQLANSLILTQFTIVATARTSIVHL